MGDAGGEVPHERALEWLARGGLLARGVVYLVLAILAVKLAVGEKGTTANQQEALRTIAEQPFGKVLLILVAIGLAGLTLWTLIRAALGHGVERTDSDWDRITVLGSAVAYGVICATAVEIIAGSGASSSSPQQTTGGILGWPGGTVIVAVTGAVIIVIGLYQGYKGLARKFLEEANVGEMTAEVRRIYTALGLFGYTARSIVFVLVGYGLIQAAVDFDPKEAVALDGALHELANSTLGPPLLWLVALGLAGYAFFSFVDSRYHRV